MSEKATADKLQIESAAGHIIDEAQLQKIIDQVKAIKNGPRVLQLYMDMCAKCGICAEQCGGGLPECAGGFSCENIGEGVDACIIPEDGGGCCQTSSGQSDGRTTAGTLLLSAFVGLLLLARRRRRQ